MSRFLYTLLLRLLSPLIWLWMSLRARKAGGEWQVLSPERFGRYENSRYGPSRTGAVWVHAVSLGETRAAQPLIQALLGKGFTVLLTHTTPTGKAEGGRLFASAIATGQLRQAWLPYDFPRSVQRFLEFHKPRCGILIEREVWPNLIRTATQAGVSMVLVSARFSESSLRQSRWMHRTLRRAYASLDLVLAQTQDDADRLRQVGAHGPHVAGNLKFDVALDAAQLEEGRQWRRVLARPTIVIASTRDGEEEMFLQAIRRRQSASSESVETDRLAEGALHIFVPRHPQRFDEVAAMLDAYGHTFTRRTARRWAQLDESVFLGDSLGEMAFYYGAADVVIMGGGFAPFGGQNLIEACAAGTPVIVGPSMYNFHQATRDAVEAGAAIQVPTVEEALGEAHALLCDTPRRQAMRAAALQWLAAHAGATARIMDALSPWLGDPRLPHDSGR